MQDDLPETELRAMWLNQPTEASKMTSKLIEQRLRELRAKTRKKLIGSFAGPFVAGMFCAYGLKEFAGLGLALQVPFACAVAWSLAGVYFLNRGMWPAAISGDMGLSTGLEFCRREIGRHRDLVRRVLVWSFGPIMLAIATFVVALVMVSTRERGIFPNGLPFLTLVVVWVVAWFVIRLREQRGLQREIDELNDVETNNRRN
ncbi:MAG TPA: hypothetical protein VKB79_15680 [Bryobacteraceae bacterium]|nr:hypothetical protein [Bryobacteraceae bacterium]